MTFCSFQYKSLYICDTKPNVAGHHGLHTNTAPYVITESPGKGDTIQYVLRGSYSLTYNDNNLIASGEASLTLFDYEEKANILVISHLGRSCSIGEDGAEDAFGEDVSATLFMEKLFPTEKDWGYAPCSIKKEKSKPIYLKFKFTDQGWEQIFSKDEEPTLFTLEI